MRPPWCRLRSGSGARALDPSTSEEFSEQFDVEALRSAVIEARQAETQARLAVRTAEERIAAYESRAKDLQATASAEREARAQTRSGGRTATTGEDRHRGPCCCGWRREPT